MNKLRGNINRLLWRTVFLLVLLSLTEFAEGRVKGIVVAMPQPNLYKVAIVPEESWTPPSSITNTATITLKVPTGTVRVADLQSLTGLWEVQRPLIAPLEAPNHDYLIFNLVSPLTNTSYIAGTAIDLFLFKNSGTCTPDIQIMDQFSDPFLPPNSLNANVGNYFTILGYGTGNAYEGSLESTQLQNCGEGIQYELEYTPPVCSEDSVKARVVFKAGTPPMRTVLKKDNSFTAYINILTEIGESWTIPENLGPGDYTLFLTDAAPDTVRYTFTIDTIEPLDIIILYKEDISCNDTDGALVHLLPKGITSDESYSFDWSSGHTTDVVEGLRPGPYQVTLTDGIGCTTRKFFEVDGVPPIDIELKELVHPSCPGSKDGFIEVDVTGGIGIQYFYEWNDPNFPKRWTADNLEGGEYQLTVFDVSGCVGSTKISLDIPPPIEPEIDIANPTCSDFLDGHIQFKPNADGALPFVFSVNNSTTTGETDYSELPAGTYDVLITDSRNCSKQEQLILEEPEDFSIDLGEDRTFLIGESRSLVNNSRLDNPSYQYEWFPAQSLSCSDCPNPVASPKETTTYSVIVTNEEGCYREDEVTININLDRPVYFPTAFSPNGDGNNDYFEIPPGKTTDSIIRLRIFNRWGQLLYDSDVDSGPIRWNGYFGTKLLDKGVYIFAADILFLDGVVLPYHGDVLLVR